MNVYIIIGLPRTRQQYNLIWVIVDLMKKFSNRGTLFTSQFLKSFQTSHGTNKLNMNFHPQAIMQTKRIIKTLKYILSSTYVFNFTGNWDDHLPLI